MQRFAKKIQAQNTPHFKTHKSSHLVNAQIANGSKAITCATLSEAELLTRQGIKNIILAYPVVGKINYQRFINLLEYTKVIPVFDSVVSVKNLDEYLKSRTIDKVDYYLEIDTGLNRLGVLPEVALKIIKKLLSATKVMNLIGILSHAGHSYSCKNVEEVYEIAMQEHKTMLTIKEIVKKETGLDLEISLGSTPTLKSGFIPEGITNIRPGNYVYNDAIGINIGYSSSQECALRIISRVISKHGSRIIIDAGSKSLGLDLGAHSMNTMDSYGLILDRPGSNKIIKDMKIKRLSEEHGIIENLSDKRLKVGDVIEIIPNHACYVANLFDNMYLVDNESNILEKLKVDGRGLST
ncbi:MAG: amino-acid racemase [Candidatus Muiribacterium halophilum]|uniref:Amino-acid racemase n=1 Tax=Muiribacterium halophilum TaxID=2053465 RepID=A0A2N5ZAU8_MUIH1|nr:MAG: amino-acid racemase [Candidatus Muirbacterium halophilum]